MSRFHPLALVALLAQAWPCGAEQSAPQPAPFSAQRPGAAPPSGWAPITVPGIAKTTRFDLWSDGGTTVLRAASDAAASSLGYPLRLDPAKTPRLAWRWKVTRIIERADLATKAGDDHAARVYVFFDYDPAQLPFAERVKIVLARSLYGADLPTAALCYVWNNRYPVGTRAWSAYTDRVRMIVLESGSARVGSWVDESRDVAADFREAFGAAPPAVTGVAVAADTDNTGEAVVTYFGDLAFHFSERR
jgi:hypothetical protein